MRRSFPLLVCMILTAAVLGGCSGETAGVTPAESAAVSAEASYEEADLGATNTEAPEEGDEKEQTLSFPMEAEAGKIRIGSLFTSDVINPDGGMQEGTDLATLEVSNISGEYLQQMTAEVELEDGTVYRFTIEDLPAGGSCWAFDTANAAMTGEVLVTDLSCKAIFGDYEDLASACEITCEGTQVRVKNPSDEDLKDLKVICHEEVDGIFFGGTSTVCTIDSLESGSETVVEPEELILLGSVGVAAVRMQK